MNQGIYGGSGQRAIQRVLETEPKAITVPMAARWYHGERRPPKIIRGVLVCVTTEASYAVGDEVSVESCGGNSPTAWGSATEVGVTFVNAMPSVIPKPGSTSAVALTAANWKVKVYAIW